MDGLRLRALARGKRPRLVPRRPGPAVPASALRRGARHRADPVRWLLADEVGLGKTIEACLILNRLVHTRSRARPGGRPERSPFSGSASCGASITRRSRSSTRRARRRGARLRRRLQPLRRPPPRVIALEMLVERPELTEQAVEAGIDLLVVDEAHRLRRPPGHPGEPAWRAVAPIAGLGRHVLLLSATPLEDDAHGFFRLLQLLRPEEFPESTTSRRGSPRASRCRRAPARRGAPTLAVCRRGCQRRSIFSDCARWRAELAWRGGRTPSGAPSARDRLGARSPQVRRWLPCSGPRDRAATSGGGDGPADPRLEWLLSQARRWRRANEKTLVFVAHRETLEMLRARQRAGAARERRVSRGVVAGAA